MPTLSLAGCAPTPLAHYLKALGILRLVAEQADPRAAGCWHRDDFVLHTSIDAEALTTFFLERYTPTPILAPWNGDGGFFPDSRKAGREALSAMEETSSARFTSYREAIKANKAAIRICNLTTCPEKGREKDALLLAVRNYMPDDSLVWFDAVAVLSSDGPKFPPLLGTGGNDGSMDFSKNHMQRLAEVFDLSTGAPSLDSQTWLRQSLFAATLPVARVKAPIGQFFPAAAGGANATSGFSSDSAANPWDFIFMIEGALVFAAAAVKRLESLDDGSLAYPFCVRQTGIGYASASTADESASRAEMWMPLWESPATHAEISALFSEGRAQVGSRSARNGVDFIRAVVTLGVDRGITAFQRFGFQARNGLSYFATPLERVIVRQHTRANLLIEIDHWLDQLRRFSGDGPASVSRALRGIETAIDNLCRHDDAPHFRALLVALGRAEQALARSFRWTTEKRLQPLKDLSADWLIQASDTDETDCELRLAAALASAHGGALRSHLEPVEGRGYWKWAAVPGNDVCWSEGRFETVLLDILTRRLSTPTTAPSLHQGRAACHARLDDIEAFIGDELDAALIGDLWWALSALDWRNPPRTERSFSNNPPSALFSLFRLCFPQPGELGHGMTVVPPVPAIVAKARAGLSREASTLAGRRLRASGFQPRLDSIEFGSEATTRTAAALLFPLHPDDFSRLQTSVFRQATTTNA